MKRKLFLCCLTCIMIVSLILSGCVNIKLKDSQNVSSAEQASDESAVQSGEEEEDADLEEASTPDQSDDDDAENVDQGGETPKENAGPEEAPEENDATEAVQAEEAPEEDQPSEPSANAGQTESSSDNPENEPKKEAAGSSDNDVASIFAKSKGIAQISFTYVVTSPEGSTEGKTWIKGEKIKNEIVVEGNRIINITDQSSKEIFLYFPEENMAIKQNYNEMEGLAQNPLNEYGEEDANDFSITGTETIDGNACTVMVATEEDDNAVIKIWVSMQYGIPLKIERTEPAGKTTIVYSNVKTGSIPDSEFELPAGVEIMTM